ASTVPAQQIAARFSQRLLASGDAQATLSQAEGRFCSEFLQLATADFEPAGLGRLSALWLKCLRAGSSEAFLSRTANAFVGACTSGLIDGRAQVSPPELDILLAMSRCACCAVAWCADMAGKAPTATYEGRDAGHGHFNRKLESQLAEGSDDLPVGLVLLGVEWGLNVLQLDYPERDRLRAALSERMRRGLRASDDLVMLGETQWALIAPGLKNAAQLVLAATRLIHACEEELAATDTTWRGRFSAGCAWAPEHASDAAGLERAARIALLSTRETGAPVQLYKPEVAHLVIKDAQLERDVLFALQTGLFELYLQPQVSLSDGACAGAECLLRWERSKGEWIAPYSIIEIIKRLGLMPQLCHQVLSKAARLLAELSQAGVPVHISVNLTASDLQDGELPDLVTQILSTWRVAPASLCLEVTEGDMLADIETSGRILRRLRELGCTIALDDFGTGYSSMAYLRQLPIDELKIDKCFVDRLTRSAEDYAVVDAILRLARAFNLEVIAEGVEDEATLEILRDLGCSQVQGYIFAKAMKPADFIAWWKTRGT
ncbi:MAG: EAL domain-containing protein, partial [Zoogloea sp.]|nr:EAL domain-containing protein [Zoogloea sp.]